MVAKMSEMLLHYKSDYTLNKCVFRIQIQFITHFELSVVECRLEEECRSLLRHRICKSVTKSLSYEIKKLFKSSINESVDYFKFDANRF